MFEQTTSALSGRQVLSRADINKGTAFSIAERQDLHLEGLLPPSIEDLDLQVKRVLEHLGEIKDELHQYVYLIDLEERNQTVFYKTIMSDPKRFIPILYDPVVADACLKFGHIYRRPRGLYITRDMKGRMTEVLRNWPEKDVRFICVTTGGRILGLGDIGANGMGIPVGKLQLYTACAAVPPEGLLPVLFDIGTSNEQLRNDPYYLGTREAPLGEEDVDELTEEFVQAVQEVFPNCCLHFEDWKGTQAIRMLNRYKDQILCYNDDIQGTASVVLAGIAGGLNIKGEVLKDQRVFFYGAGSAGTGIAKLVKAEMLTQGLGEEEANSRIAMFDVDGLICSTRNDLNEAQAPFAHNVEYTSDLVEALRMFKPTIIVGASTHAGGFTQEVVETLCEFSDQPMIFAISNPTFKVECTAEQAYTWSKGQALFAAGVQFPDFELNGKLHRPGQANNFYIYPAIGLATYVAKPKRLNDECFIVAAHAVADQINPEMREQGMLFPSQDNILESEIQTATKVVEYMFDSGLAQVERPADIRDWIEGQLYTPKY
ncbi:malate dehydrogenase (oxaloacetate-decarboxylating)(NADP+) [Celerinatantimonas diazotrophica]|uniref:Malate dehydrogenase (Oxaloacetate-decarboxylating)(NADP+) n=2 Tax=Celerinatantimonas diazotrophica TaxID=412034 RepID=A0A4R1K1Q1_9GAMM|nr:NAD-dependent malic enzyme [Celerinatantimonas diazotrophica]TCK57830.1 malate dehydrogenase (oxaloacetate-decarboxylating)(NADP+) [Celerinatantimonas diazotrophica]CAG9298106.1 putative NAD-dependent malic enzyme 2 [Celerinatantimonas diazotrophica]